MKNPDDLSFSGMIRYGGLEMDTALQFQTVMLFLVQLSHTIDYEFSILVETLKINEESDLL